MNKGVVGGVGLAYLAIGIMMWQQEGHSPSSPPPTIPIEKLRAGAAPNNSSGPGGLTPAALTNPSAGCMPAGGDAALGDPNYTFSNDAHIDTDGGTMYADPTQQGTTSSGYNSDTYPGVVLTKTMQAAGMQQGDYVLVTNNQTGQTTVGRIYDANFDDAKGISHGDQAEISDYAASLLGIQMQNNGNTIGTNDITLRGYAGTSGLPADCNQSTQTAQTAQNP
jgi:hypothetical protein